MHGQKDSARILARDFILLFFKRSFQMTLFGHKEKTSNLELVHARQFECRKRIEYFRAHTEFTPYDGCILEF